MEGEYVDHEYHYGSILDNVRFESRRIQNPNVAARLGLAFLAYEKIISMNSMPIGSYANELNISNDFGQDDSAPPYPKGFPVFRIGEILIDRHAISKLPPMTLIDGTEVPADLVWRFADFSKLQGYNPLDNVTTPYPAWDKAPHVFDSDLFELGSLKPRRILTPESFQQETAFVRSNRYKDFYVVIFPDQFGLVPGHTLMGTNSGISSYAHVDRQYYSLVNFMIDRNAEVTLDTFGGTVLQGEHCDCGQVKHAHFHQIPLPESVTEEDLIKAIDLSLEKFKVGYAARYKGDQDFTTDPAVINNVLSKEIPGSELIGDQLTYERIAADNQRYIGKSINFPGSYFADTDLVDYRIEELESKQENPPRVFLRTRGKVNLELMFKMNPNSPFIRNVAHAAIYGSLETDDLSRLVIRENMFKSWVYMVSKYAAMDEKVKRMAQRGQDTFGYTTLALPPSHELPLYIADNWHQKQNEGKELPHMLGTFE